MQDENVEALRAAIAALESQRATLGDMVLELAVAPLRARLADLQRPAGVRHRQVAVLFVDVVGSTAMAQALDAEDALEMLDGVLRRMADIVQAHQGRVLRFTGDGVKAAFGVDEAREDDAERAVRAGLAMLAAGREHAELARRLHRIEDFAVRVGVHSGDVALGAGVEADNTAMGAAVNIAARMEQSAPPGALRISHDTWNLVRGLFDFEPQPPLQIKGVDTPMKTYLVRAARDRRVASIERGLQGLETPMVGREAELQRLQDIVARARHTRQLQSLTLLGDAGLGKSRLLRELLARADDCRVLAVRSQPDGLLRPWGLLRGLLATQFGVADTDSADVARRKVVHGLGPWFEERGEQQAQLIGQLAGLDFGDSLRGLDPRRLRDQAFVALRGYLRRLAAPGAPLPLLLVEDLHWADDGSLDLLQHLQAHAAELPLALIMTSRPALATRRPDWGPPETLLPLGPLAPAHGDELARALLQRLDGAPPRLHELVAGRAEGNPYYMEELVRRLIDDGVIDTGGPGWTVREERLQDLRLPGTLVGLLQARLDALPAHERQAARLASIIGPVFWDDALQALDAGAPSALPALQRAAFVRTHATSDFEGTAERQFDHHLLHQVTYDTLLRAERRLGHGAAARWLSERTQGRGAEFLAMTGEHAARAGETALAVHCFEQAAAESHRRFANTAAIAWMRRCLDLLGASEPARRLALLSRLYDMADIVGDRATQDAVNQETAALLERHPDDALLARLQFDRALLADRRSDSAASERLARQACELAERSGAARWAAMAQGQLAWLHMARQDYPGAVAHVEKALPWARRIEVERTRLETEGQLLTLSGMISTQLGRLDEARGTLVEVLARGVALGSQRLQFGALSNLAECAARLGRWDEMAEWAERMRVLAHAFASPPLTAIAARSVGRAAAARDDAGTALRCLEESVVILRSIGDRRELAIALRFLACVHLDLRDAGAARACCAEAQALHGGLDEPCEACAIDAVAAWCELRLGRRDAALAAVPVLLERLDHDLAELPAHETIELRWRCQQVLEALADARAAPMFETLVADVQACAAALTVAADRERLIQALPVFRDIMAAHGRRSQARW